MQVLLVILGLAIGLILLVRGADEMVKCAIHIAQKYKIPQSIVGAVYIGLEHLPLNGSLVPLQSYKEIYL